MFQTLRLLLVVAVIVLAVIWYRSRDRRALWGLAGAAGALGALFLIVGLVRVFGGATDQEQIEHKIEEMAAGVKARDLDRIFPHVSENLQVGSTTKSMLKDIAQGVVDRSELSEIKVGWRYDQARITPAKDGQPATASIRFPLKIVIDDAESLFDCEAVFVKDPDGQWRLKTFQVFRPAGKDPYPIPQLSN